MRLPVFSFATRRLSPLLLSAFVVLLASPAYAQTDIPGDWPLKPAGLVAGDEFRLLFMGQNGLKATSTEIADYDAFVQGIVTRKGHADITAYAADFKMLGSTATVNARNHTGTTGTGEVPIYWLNGPKVADDYADFYDGSWSNRDAATLQDGETISQNRRDQLLCTGTNDDGTTAQPLGADPCTATTFDTTTNTLSGKTLATSAKARYLALSGVFRVEGFTGIPIPVVESVEIASDPGSDREYVAGDAIEVRVTFSESVAVTGTPRLKLMLGTQVWADYVAAQSTATALAFSYTVTAADHAHGGVSLPGDRLDLNGGTIENQAGTVDANLEYTGKGEQSRHRVYALPTVSGVAVVSTPLAHGIYTTGETIVIDLTWDKKVAVFGTPLLQIITEGSAPLASYTTTIGDRVTRFEYEVQAGDTDSNGILLMNNGVQWNGGYIIRQEHGDHADKDSLRPMLNGGATNLRTQPGHRVNVSPSTDATLDLLVLIDGDGNEIALNPEFDAATTSYTASAAAGVAEIAIETVAEGFPYATVEYLDGSDTVLADADTDDMHFQVPLSVGANTIKVKVTADDGIATETYTTEVTRAAPAPNNAATGKPAVTGTAQEGQTLNAAKGTIADADGLTGADNGDAGHAYTYQWVRVDGSNSKTDISGATSDTYTLVAADVGHTIKVEVSFKDDADNAEGPLASDATAAVTAAPSADATLSALALEDGSGNAIALNPAFTSARKGYTASVAKDVDAITIAPTTNDDGATVEYLDGGDNAIADADTVADDQQVSLAVGANTVNVKVTAQDGNTTETYAVTVARAAPNTAATGKPAITGRAQVGGILSAGTGTVSDADGLTKADNRVTGYTYSYRWVRVDSSDNETDIPGATAATYTLAAADVGHTIKVKVSFKDDAGNAEGPLASDAVPKAGTVGGAAGAACPADADWCTEVTLSYTSTAVTDAMLSERWGYGSDANPGAIDDATFSHGETAYTVSGLDLYRFTMSGSGASDLLTLKVKFGDLPDGTVLTLDGTEFAIDEQSHTQTLGKEQWSFAPPGLPFHWMHNQQVTVSLTLPPAGTATGKPAIAGAPQVGEALTAGLGTIADVDGVPGTVAYQWVRVDADGSSNPTNIGTNSSTYAPVAADVGKRIRVEVSFTDDGGNAEGPLASNAVPEAGTVVPAKAACPAVADWCTEMTLYYTAAHQPHFYERWGYTSISTPSGAIDDNTYSHGGREYTIERLGLNRDHLNSGSNDLLTFDLTYEPVSGELPDGTVLTLDGAEFTVGIVSDTLETGKEQWSPMSMGISLNWVKGQKVTVSLTFPSADATLGALALTDGDGNAIPLNPAFQSATTLYTASVDNAVSRIEVAPTTNDGGAKVEYLDGSGTAIADADGNDEEQQVALAVGPNTIGVKVTAADRVATRTYTLTVTRAPGSAAATGKPAIAGTAQAGHTLTAGIGTIADDDGLPSTFPDDYTFQWVRVDADGTNPEDIADATGHTYTPVAADGGKKIRVKVSFTDNTDTPEGPLESDATATVAAVSADATLTALVLGDEHGSAIALDPTFESGKTSYTASVGNAVAEITVTPELSGDDATVAYLDGSDSAIADADTGATGQQVALAVGPNTIKVKVTAEDGATQTYTVVVSRSGGNPAIVGTAQVGHTLTAAKGEIDDAEGTTKADNGDAGYAYTYQWVRVDADGTSNPHDIGSATSNTYTLVAADEGKKVKVKLSFKDDADNVEERTSDAFPASGTVAAGGGGLIATLVEREPVEGTGGRLHYVFDLHLSTGVSKSYRDVRDHVFTVAGGSTVGARRIHRENQPRPGTNQLALVSNHWRVEVRPSTDDGEVTVQMTANLACDQDGALCELDGSALSNAPSLLLAAFYPSMSIADTSAEEDDGELRFTVTLSRASQRYDVLYDIETVAGGSATESVDYTAQARVTNRIQKGAVTQELVVPLIDDAVNDDGETVKVRIGNARLEDAGGAQRMLAITRAEATGTIGSADTTPQPALDALTASFENVPLEHNGYTHFTLRLAFSAPIVTSPTVLRDQALTVTGGAVTAVRQVNGRSDLWEITVDQSGTAPVTVRLAASAPCDQPGAVCTADGRALSNAPSATVRGKPALSVADAEVEEAPGAMLVFVVTLDRPPTAPVTVNWKTLDRTATAGQDYTEASGSIAFDVGETAKTISVAVLDDAIDEGDETLFLLLPSAQGARSVDPLAVGTIRNSDPLQQEWLARFGRTVADQVLEAVEVRIGSAPQAGVQAMLAGERIGPGSGAGTGSAAPSEEEARDAEPQDEAEARERLVALSQWLRGEADRDSAARSGPRPVESRELLIGSSFALSAEADGMGGGVASLWGRGAWTRFDGRQGELSLSGEVTNTMLGLDWTRDPGSRIGNRAGSGSGAGGWTAGLMLSHALGEGSYRGASAGTVESTLTGLYPYGRYALNDRVTVWGVAGYGAGTLTLKPGDGAALRTDMGLEMAAAGLRGVAVKAPPGGGPELAVEADAMAVRTSSDAVTGGAGGNLAAATGEATRLRLGLEGSWRGLEVARGVLAPKLEVGIRRDGGDAETGFGLDAGAGLAWSDASSGLQARLSGRGILTHESGGFQEQGVAGSLSWQPRPERGRGPMLSVSQTMGSSATGGVNALLSRRTMAGLGANDDDPLERRQLEVRFGYGFAAIGDRFTSTPEIGFGKSNHHREYSLGWRLNLAQDSRMGLEVRLNATRREAANDPGSGSGAGTDPEHMAAVRLTATW